MTGDIIEADGVESLRVAQAASPDNAEFVVDCPATREHNARLSDFESGDD